MIKEDIEQIWERWSDERSEPYKDMFFQDCEEAGELIAIFNLGFHVGWEDRNSHQGDE